jgi:hypothetical protein
MAERNDVFFMRTSQNTIIGIPSDIFTNDACRSGSIRRKSSTLVLTVALNAFNEVRLRAD